jgi:hypothetical protein
LQCWKLSRRQTRIASVDVFVDKALDLLDAGVHVVVVDLFPPSRFDPYGMPGAIRERWDDLDESFPWTPAEPLTLASYVAGPVVEAYSENRAPGSALPEMPLFLTSQRYVNLPLESTYDAAYQGMPAFWRDVLDGRGRWI